MRLFCMTDASSAIVSCKKSLLKVRNKKWRKNIMSKNLKSVLAVVLCMGL